MNALGWGISAMSGILALGLTRNIFDGLTWFGGVGLAMLVLIYFSDLLMARRNRR